MACKTKTAILTDLKNSGSSIENLKVIRDVLNVLEKINVEQLKNDKVSRPDRDTERVLPREYYNSINRLVKKVIGTKVTTSKYLAFSRATLENLAVIGGKFAKDRVVLSKRPNQEALEREAKGMLQKWFLEESPYGVKYQAMEVAELVEALRNDPEYKAIGSEFTPKVAAEMVAAWGNVNGAHTLAHEIVHAGSKQFMVENPEHEATKRVNELYQEAMANKEEVLRLMGKGANTYWTTSVDEFIAEGLSNPDLVYALKNLRTEEMGRLSNLFRDLVAKLLEMVGMGTGSNVYEYLMDGYAAMIESIAKPTAANEVLDQLRETVSNIKSDKAREVIANAAERC